jgi:hypothetical protein
MIGPDEQLLRLLQFIASNTSAGTANEDHLRAEFGSEMAVVLGRAVDAGYVRREVFPLHETQAAATARMPHDEAVVVALTDAGRQAIQ